MTGVVLAGIQFLCQVLISSLIFGLLLIVEPWTAFGAFGLIAIFYLVIFLSRRVYLTNLGRERLATNLLRYATFVDLMTGIRTIKSDGSLDFFQVRFENASKRFSAVHPKIQFAAAVPRYVVECFSFGGIVLATMFIVSSGTELQSVVSKFTLLALAGYRLLPAINGSYNSIVQVLSNYTAIESIYDDLCAAASRPGNTEETLTFENIISLRNVGFRYQGSQDGVSNVSLEIKHGEKVAFVGPSGSGKTTLANVIMALLRHQEGEILIDSQPIDDSSIGAWRNIIGYVPQDVFLFDSSIEENIAFGRHPIDRERMLAACKVAQIDEFVLQLPDEFQTVVGEQGMRMSGGQRQRIGLARALYRQPKVLILDEATSALDNITEKLVVEAIHRQLPGITILMIAHRISTVKACDRLLVFDRGKLEAQGSYEELVESSQLFRDLASFS